MAPGSGRKLACEWNDVTKLSKTVSGKVILQCQCNYCNEIINSQKVERIRIHLNKCKKKKPSADVVERNKNFILKDGQVSSQASINLCNFVSPVASESFEASSTSGVFESSYSGSTPTPYKKQKLIENYISRTSSDQKDVFDLQVAKFFFACNIPFNAVENREFKKCINFLRPGYDPPNRKKLSSELLDKVNDEVIVSMKSEFANNRSTITLIQDGWSSVRNDPVIAHSVHNGKTPYLISAIDAGSEKKTSEYCAQLAIEAIKHIKKVYEQDVFAICTDNENKMKKMKEILKEEYPLLLTYGCSAHYLNLVEKQVTHFWHISLKLTSTSEIITNHVDGFWMIGMELCRNFLMIHDGTLK
nr:uncharacterized protein LOC124810501 [Hydra vulgaris]